MNDDFEMRAVLDNGVLSRDFGLYGDVYEELLNYAGIRTRSYRRDEIERLQEQFWNFYDNSGLDRLAEEADDPDEVIEAANEIRAFFKRLLKEDRGFCAGSPPKRPDSIEEFVRPSWERRA